MTSTAEMLAPRLSGVAIDAAHRIRAVLSADLDEYDMADRARELEPDIAPHLSDVWQVLNSNERAAWKQLLKLERPNGY